MYQKFFKIAEKLFGKATIFKYGFNLSPMYRLSTARIKTVSEDLMEVKIRIPINWRNRNYVGSVFGGSLFAATDPIYMIQLFHILGEEYIVWDKAACIKFKRPVYKPVFATFKFTEEEIAKIKEKVLEKQEIDYIKPLEIVDENGKVHCSLDKTLYIATKKYYKEKLAKRKKSN